MSLATRNREPDPSYMLLYQCVYLYNNVEFDGWNKTPCFCMFVVYMSWQMYLTESDTLGGVFWKSWPDWRRFRAIWLDAWSCALCGAGQQHVTVRPSCSGREKHRQVSGQADNSPAPEAFGLTPQSKYICICLEIFLRGGSCLEKSAIDCWRDHKRSMMLRLSEQVRWSLRLFRDRVHCWGRTGDKLTSFFFTRL